MAEGGVGESPREALGASDSPATAAGNPDSSITVVCRQVVELVTDYLEGALPGDLHAAVERHLELCPPCVTYIEQMRATAASLRDVPVESIHPRARAELVAAFRELVPRSGPGPA
jgi:anti-sigma factor RsiW